jgi:DNA replication protein DnaC
MIMIAKNPDSASGEPSDSEIARLAVDLDLTTLPAALSDLLNRAERDSLSYTEFAASLLRTEWDARQERKLSRGLKRSHLGAVEGLEGFNFSLRPQLEPRVVKELLNCRFLQENRNIICVGKPGLGKTRIAKAIAHAACLRGYSVLFVVAIDMLEDLHASLADGSFKRAFRRYTKPSLVVIDELGYEGLNSKHANYLYRLVSARHGRGSVIITANVGFSKWASFFPSDSQAVPTVDRLLDRATILRFTGKSFREPAEIHGAPLDE